MRDKVIGTVAAVLCGRNQINAAGVPGVAAGDALDSQPGSLEKAVATVSLGPIRGTAGVKPASTGK